MYRQFNILNFYVLPTQCIYVLCVDLRKIAVRTALFWAVTQCVVVIYYQRFGTTRWSHLQWSRFYRQVIPKRR